MALPKGSWEGSDVSDNNITYLCGTWRLLPEMEVEARAPDGELMLEPREGEVVVFYNHFARGFGLSMSDFYRRFLDFFGLQPHYLGANVVLQLAASPRVVRATLGSCRTSSSGAGYSTSSSRGRRPAACPPVGRRWWLTGQMGLFPSSRSRIRPRNGRSHSST